MTAPVRARVEFRAVGGPNLKPNTTPSEYRTPLAGAGTIDLGPEGARLEGPRVATVLPTVLGVVTGILGVIIAAIIMVSLDINLDGRGSGKLALLVGMGAGILPGIGVHHLLRTRMRGGTIAADVPRTALRILARAPGSVTLRLAAHELRGDVEVVATDPASAAAIDAWNPV